MTIKLILSIAITWGLTKLIKITIDTIKEKKFSRKIVMYNGGLFSSHTAAIIATTTAIFFETGFSALLALSIMFSLIIINDALNVRRVTEEQSRAINKLTKGMKGFTKLSEHIGHKPREVIFGLLIGIIIPIIIYII